MARPEEEALRNLWTDMVDSEPMRPQEPFSFDRSHVTPPEEDVVRGAGDRNAVLVDRDPNERDGPVKPAEPSTTPLRIDGHHASLPSAWSADNPSRTDQIHPSTYGNQTRNQARDGLDNDESHDRTRLTPSFSGAAEHSEATSAGS